MCPMIRRRLRFLIDGGYGEGDRRGLRHTSKSSKMALMTKIVDKMTKDFDLSVYKTATRSGLVP